jgi:pyridoxamine 5'-phosphate oxidase
MDSLTSHTDYGTVGLTEAEVNPDPMAQFAAWLKVAEEAEIFEPNAMVLGTVDPDGQPSSRTVLLKGLDETGFEFVSNYDSHKGLSIAAHPQVSLLFPWYTLKRQVIVYGTASPTASAVSDAYFLRRPHGARLAALASEQSRIVLSRDVLDERMAALEERYPEGSEVPRPQNWGGFRVIPSSIEFWQGRSKRFHDRLRFTRVDGSWQLDRLQP